MYACARRRLLGLRLALSPAAAGDATADVGVLESELSEAEWQDVEWRMNQGELATSGVSAATLRALMRPEPDGPTETERILADLPADIGLGEPPRLQMRRRSGRGRFGTGSNSGNSFGTEPDMWLPSPC